MTTYNPAEVERLVRAVRSPSANEDWVALSEDLADQLEAARARIAELECEVDRWKFASRALADRRGLPSDG